MSASIPATVEPLHPHQGVPGTTLHAVAREIGRAQERLEDDFPRWNESGKDYAVLEAARALRAAHRNLIHCIESVSPESSAQVTQAVKQLTEKAESHEAIRMGCAESNAWNSGVAYGLREALSVLARNRPKQAR